MKNEMNEVGAIKTLVGGFGVLFLGVCMSVAAELRRPNVVILLSDDLGSGDIGCYDGPADTPNLDLLAAGGIRFTDFYSGCAVCSPSRATMMTGRHHIRTGVYSWIFDSEQRSHLLEREVTVAEILKESGYATAHFGKWHLGLPSAKFDKPTPSEHGFDYWFATVNNARPSHRNPTCFIRNGEAVGKLEGYACQLVVDEAIDWLDNRDIKDQPFFLNVWFHEPHQKIAAPQELVDKYPLSEGDEAFFETEQSRIYTATIDNTDLAIGHLLEKLKEVAPSEETLIIYSSDNGSYQTKRNGALKGRKGSNWEGGLRVPGIFYWPGEIEAGRVCREPAGLVDVLPTLCSLLGREDPENVHIDGSSLAPILTQKTDTFRRHQPLFWHLQKSRPIVAIRDGKYSLVAEPDFELSQKNMFDESWIPIIKAGSYKDYKLYDLETDPSQENDIASSNPELTEKLKSKLLQINASVMAEGADWHLE